MNIARVHPLSSKLQIKSLPLGEVQIINVLEIGGSKTHIASSLFTKFRQMVNPRLTSVSQKE